MIALMKLTNGKTIVGEISNRVTDSRGIEFVLISHVHELCVNDGMKNAAPAVNVPIALESNEIEATHVAPASIRRAYAKLRNREHSQERCLDHEPASRSFSEEFSKVVRAVSRQPQAQQQEEAVH